MADNEVALLKAVLDQLDDKIDRVESKVDIIGQSLRTCQQHCYIDNPPIGKWRVFFRSLLALFKLR